LSWIKVRIYFRQPGSKGTDNILSFGSSYDGVSICVAFEKIQD